jgi:endonuclease/exonuclease/phosphatase family metal-dependent hydrolase
MVTGDRVCRPGAEIAMMNVLILLILLCPLPASAAELKIATWNLDWLTTRQAGERGLPDDVVPRSAEDFDRLAKYALDLNADVVAIEEVDGWGAASKLFPRDQYSIHMTRDHVVQRVGFAVRRGLHYDANPDLTGLALGHLRSGADITLHPGGRDLRVLAVHLKKGCRDQPLQNARGQACSELGDQVPPLADWIAARKQDGVPFLVLGDFNRSMDGKDVLLASLRRAAPLARATEGHSSPCWGNESFIDHILAGGAAAEWMRPDTLRVLTYRETDPGLKDRLSDHCPVSVRLAVPD